MSSHQNVFPAAGQADWQTLVEKVLKGASSQSLARRDEDDLDIQALYPVGEDDGAMAPLGPLAKARLVHGWDVAQPIMATIGGDRDSLLAVNQMILDAVESGATSLILFVDDASANHFDRLFDQVILPAIDVQFCAGADTCNVAKKFADYARRQPNTILNINVGHDPLSFGCSAIENGLALLDSDLSVAGLFHFDGWDWHNRGLTAAQEIGLVLSGLAALLRRGQDRDLETIVDKCNVSMALPADSFLGLGKVRAMRLGWAGLCKAFGIDNYPLFITGITSLRMMSLLDQDVNMLRNATAFLGGAIGGADRMAGFSHDFLSQETEAGRRLTRTTQLMMIEESGLACSLDPAAGAPFLEQRSDDLSVAAWAVMQQIEEAGGLDAALQSGLIASMASKANARRHAALSSGETQLVGVTLQPSPDPSAAPTGASRFAGLSRPASIVESFRHTKSAKRILILSADESDKNEERDLQRWLATGGLTAVTLKNHSPEDIATAAPDIVILCTDVADIVLPDKVQILTAKAILSSKDQLGMLANVIGDA